ncbi:MAG: hypothetical protein Q9209_001464 [Squamulea sp. 1 TL-2023]
MALDPTNHNANIRTSTSIKASRSTGSGTNIPTSVRSPVFVTAPILRRNMQGPKQHIAAIDSKENMVTPVRTVLSPNVTPRSGSRKTRVESATSTPKRTPECTPPTARPISMIEGRDWLSRESQKPSASAATRGHTSRPERARSVASDVQYTTNVSPAGSTHEKGSRNAGPENLPKFFHANDAKPRLQTRAQSQSPRLQPKLAGIQSINGVSDHDTSALTTSPMSEVESPKFFRMPEATSPPPRFANGIVSARPPLQTIFSSYQTTSSPAQRPPSPLKEEVLPLSRKSSLSKPSPRRHTRLVSNGSNDIRAPDSLIKGQVNLSRRSSVGDQSRRISQPQSPTTASFGFNHSRRSSLAMSDSGRDSGASTMLRAVGSEPPPPAADDSFIEPPESIPSQSPNKPAPGRSKLDHLNELAAKARRERKVLDLEISNSSLLAINRTLETEMRKQKAELRHLRRLRSSGHFPSSTRSASSRFSMPSTNDDLSPTSSVDEYTDDDRFSDASSGISDDTSFPDSSSFSPTLRNLSIPVAKGRQSRSFKVDLAGQRVLLLDSQRLNQALKRCLDRTDELIVDGKKALEYEVDTREVANMGPRVLAPDDRNGKLTMGKGLLSPGLDERLENPWESEWSRNETDNWDRSAPDDFNIVKQEDDPQDDTTIPDGEDLEKTLPDKLAKDSGLEISSDRQDMLEAAVEASVDALLESLGNGTKSDVLAPEEHHSDNAAPSKLDTPNTKVIPYEDPGIDTGGETSTIEDDGSEPLTSSQDTVDQSTDLPFLSKDGDDDREMVIDVSQPESSDIESTTPEESTISSPGKGLGGFLRMVGGSWGV